MPRVFAALALVAACSSGTRAPSAPSRQAPTQKPSDAGADSAALGERDLYRNGKRFASNGSDDDRYTCRATTDAAAACEHAGAGCALAPPVQYWEGPMRCSGVQRPIDLGAEQKRLDALAIPTCQCTCDAGWKAASAASQQQREACSRVP